MDDSISFLSFFLKQPSIIKVYSNFHQKKHFFVWKNKLCYTHYGNRNPFNRPIIGVIIKEKLLIARKNLLFLPLNM